MLLKQLLEEKREQILHLAAKHGAFNVRVFGSVDYISEKFWNS